MRLQAGFEATASCATGKRRASNTPEKEGRVFRPALLYQTRNGTYRGWMYEVSGVLPRVRTSVAAVVATALVRTRVVGVPA